MKINPKVSVIVPVYKAEAYLRRCVDSILAQTFKDFEVLLVDDGSPDGCNKICDEYAEKYSHVRVFHKENGGVTKARELGVKQSRGEWITFVDSDDSLPINSLSALYEVANKNDGGIIIGAWQKVSKKGRRLIPLSVNGSLSSIEFQGSLLDGRCYSGPVGKLFRKNLFDSNTFSIPSKITNNEDLIMNLRVGLKSNRILALPTCVVYEYHDNENSASKRQMSMETWDEAFTCIEESVSKDCMLLFFQYVSFIFYRNKDVLNYRKSKFYFQLEEYYRRKNMTKLGLLYMNCLVGNCVRISKFLIEISMNCRRIYKFSLYYRKKYHLL